MANGISARRQLPGLFLAIVCCAAVGVYWPGLSGGFMLDDYTQIVINDGLLLPADWTLGDLLAAANSSNSGPFGRPLAMVSFALNRLPDGLDPWWFKIFNVLIHVINTLLVYVVARRIYGFLIAGKPEANGLRAEFLAVLAAALWGLHPFNLTSVLYVVQRMTSLSVTFSLVACLAYWDLRARRLPFSIRVSLAAAILLCSVAAVLTKETALLIPAFFFLFEFTLLGFRGTDGRSVGILKYCYLCLIAVPVVLLAYRFFQNPMWLSESYGGRPFSLSDRVYTQFVVLWFYLKQIALPNITAMGLHHDDFPIRRALLEDGLTFLAVAGHILLLGIALRVRARLPLVSMAILWFYVGHLLESTVWPLEMVYEHRNYLPMMGLAICAAWYLPLGLFRLVRPGAAATVLGLFVCLLGGTTMVRAAQWGDALTFAMVEAEKHPASGRANFDAGRELVVTLLRLKRPEPELGRLAMDYLAKSTSAAMITVEPYIVAFQAQAQLGTSPPEGFFNQFVEQLRSGYLPNGTYGLAQGLLSIYRFGTRPLTADEGKILFEAVLSNRRLTGVNRGHLLIAYSIFSVEIEKDSKKAYALAEQSLAVAPDFIPFKTTAGMIALADGRIERARQLVADVEANDPFRMYRQETEHIKSIIAQVEKA